MVKLYWTAGLVVCLFVCIELIDRPLATFVHVHFAGLGKTPFVTNYRGRELPVTVAMLLLAPAQIVSLASPLGILVLGAARIALRTPPPILLPTLTACITTSLGLEVKEELKRLFGRTWPESWAGDNVSWIRDGVFEFHFGASGISFGSFPSGHMTAIVTFTLPLCRAYPRLVLPSLLCWLMVAGGLILGNYHFLSDIIAGAALALAIDWLFRELFRDKAAADATPPHKGDQAP